MKLLKIGKKMCANKCFELFDCEPIFELLHDDGFHRDHTSPSSSTNRKRTRDAIHVSTSVDAADNCPSTSCRLSIGRSNMSIAPLNNSLATAIGSSGPYIHDDGLQQHCTVVYFC